MLNQEILDSLERCQRGWTGRDGTFHPPGTCISVTGQHLSEQVITRLAACFPATLTTLDLQRSRIGDEGARALAAHLPATLTMLDLGFNSIGDEGAKGLAPHLPATLTTLDLRFNSIGAEGAKALAPHLPATLTKLNLCGNGFGNEGAKALAPQLPATLTTLILGSNGFGDEGAKALAPHLPATLTTLQLCGNSIGTEGVKALAAYLPATLALLDLWGNGFGNEGAKALAPYLPATLTTLELGHNFMDVQGIKTLAPHLPATLTTLDLRFNSIGAEGAKALAAYLPAALTKLDLGFNSIGAEGAKALAAYLPATLTELELTNNFIGTEGAQAIIDQLDRLIGLQFLELSSKWSGLSDSVISEHHRDPWALRDAFRAAQQALAAGQFALVGKAVILGNGGGGKSHLADWLIWHRVPPAERERRGLKPPSLDAGRDATHAFNQFSFQEQLTLDGMTHDLDLNLYDFGGQVEIHSAHRFFMSDRRNLFIILVSAAHEDGRSCREGERGRTLEYYLRMAHHHGPQQPVIVVVGWSDVKGRPNGKAWPDLENLRRIHPNTRIVRDYSNKDGRKLDEVAKAIHAAVNDPTMADQIRQPAGDFFRTARKGIQEQKSAAQKVSSRRPPLGFVSAEIKGRDPRQTPWYPRLFEGTEYQGKVGLPLTAILMLRDMGEVHFVGDRRLRLDTSVRAKDTEAIGQMGRARGTEPPATSAEEAARALNDLFFSPDDIKTGVYNVLRVPEKDVAGVLSESALRDRLAVGGLTEEVHQDQVILLMEACELIYRLAPGTDNADHDPSWLVPDHLRAAPEAEVEAERRAFGGTPDGVWTPPFLPDAVLWRYLGPKFSNFLHIAYGAKRPLYRDMAMLEVDGAEVLLIARPDDSKIELFVESSDAAKIQAIIAKTIADLDEMLGVSGIGVPRVKRKPDRELIQRQVAQWLGQRCQEHRSARRGVQPENLILGRYVLVKSIGEGGFGIAYEAAEWGSGARATLKATPYAHADDPNLERAKLEYEKLAPLIAGQTLLPRALAKGTLDIAEPNGRDGHPVHAFVVIREFIDGQPIDQWSQANDRKWTTIGAAFLQVCDAVQELHDRGVHHLDLKPSNILVDRSNRAWVIDLGAARDARLPVGITKSSQGRPFTPKYAAPEQLMLFPLLGIDMPGHGIGAHSDVFALGRILAELTRALPSGELPDRLKQIAANASNPVLEGWGQRWQVGLAKETALVWDDFYDRLSTAYPALEDRVPLSELPVRSPLTVRELASLVASVMR
jgi:Ran GTPase-activating protein (RanGAP) involved in mRNA processing and transport